MDYLLWILPVFGAVMMWWDARLPARNSWAIAIFAVCSFAATAAGFYFRQHYFIQMLPAMALLSGVALSRSIYLVRQDRTIELLFAVTILLLFSCGVLASLIGNGSHWFNMTPAAVVREVYGTTIFAEARKIGVDIREHSTPSSRIAVLGSEPEIYFYSRRRSVTGYIYMYSLMEKQALAPRMQHEFIDEIETGRPQYAVYVSGDFTMLAHDAPDNVVAPWWDRYWPLNMDLAGTYDIRGREPKDVVPGDLDNTQTIRQPADRMASQMLVFRRK
jgi:hypothetical protein